MRYLVKAYHEGNLMKTFYKYFTCLTLLTLQIYSFELSGGRPIGDNILNFNDKNMPFRLLHLKYDEAMNADTTEKILALSHTGQISDVYVYKKYKENSDGEIIVLDTLTLLNLIHFEYIGNKPKSAVGKIMHWGQWIPEIQKEYNYCDSTVEITFSSSNFPGDVLNFNYKDIYISSNTTSNKVHNHYEYIDLGNKQSNFWSEKYNAIEVYDELEQQFYCSIKNYIESSDTVWTNIEYSASNDTTITTVTQKTAYESPIVLERVIKTYNTNGTISSIESEIRQDSNNSLNKYSLETFTYFSDSMRYECSFYDTTSSSFKLRNVESHVFQLDGRYNWIYYYEVIDSRMQLKAEDLFTYSSNPTDLKLISNEKINNRINIKKSVGVTSISLTVDSQKSHLKATLFNIAGRKIGDVLSETYEGNQVFNIDINDFASGRYFFMIKYEQSKITIPIVIQK